MNPLEKLIIEKIIKEGPITFETFMDMALYYPELGYYKARGLEIGRQGDFYTSPHLHKIFGIMIGKQLQEMWEIMGKPSDFCAIEIGAGEGHLCRDMLEYLRDKEFFNSLTYLIIEINPAMKQRQNIFLTGFPDKIRWVSSLGELQKIRGCIFSRNRKKSPPPPFGKGE
ncbi:MAG: SAM-dependent methyltransferase [Nitrospirae bacterium]|nr:SAM-dependent methyltransferase [Nitrospirota bacterium]